jgi:hypothetical protein
VEFWQTSSGIALQPVTVATSGKKKNNAQVLIFEAKARLFSNRQAKIAVELA